MMPTPDKHFFHLTDGGATYLLVAQDLPHAQQLLRDAGVELTADDGSSYPVDAPEVGSARWRELSAAAAAEKHVWLGTADDGKSPRVPLTDCAVGDWFCSEY